MSKIIIKFTEQRRKLAEEELALMEKSNKLLEEANEALERFNQGGCKDWTLWDQYQKLYQQSTDLCDKAREISRMVRGA